MTLLTLLLLAAYSVAYFFRFQDLLMALVLASAMLVGWLVYWADGLMLAKYYTQPGEVVRPVTRTLLMLLVFWPLAIFVLTSTGNVIGIGLVLGLGVGLTGDVVRLRNQEVEFKTYFHFPVSSQLNGRETGIIGLIWGIVFLLLAVARLL